MNTTFVHGLNANESRTTYASATDDGWILHGGNANIVCRDGYAWGDGTATESRSVTCTDGVWATSPNCVKSKLGLAEQFVSSYITCVRQLIPACDPPTDPGLKYQPVETIYLEGSTLSVECPDTHYQATNGQTTSTCTNGTWQLEPECEYSKNYIF